MKTPPRNRHLTTATTVHNTPLKRNSQHFSNAEPKTRETVDPTLYAEFSGAIFRDCQKFFDLYFNSPNTLEYAGKLYHTLEHSITSSKPSLKYASPILGFPEPAVEKNVINWFLEKMNEISKLVATEETPSKFHSSRNRIVPGGQCNRKPDIMLINSVKIDPLKEYNESPYRWWMFHVVGELKENPDYDERKGFVQLVGYVREIFGAQPGRRFVHGFSLYGDCMRCWVFDRVGAVGSEIFSINNSPELFCRTIAAYTTMNLEELGFDTTMKVLEYNTSKSFEDLEIFNPTNEAHRMRKHITLLVERPGVQGIRMI